MRKKEPPHASQPAPQADPGVVRLEDLDQHIAERINQLGEPPPPLEVEFKSEAATAARGSAATEQQPDRFGGGFEPFEHFEYGSGSRAESMRAAYREVSQNYQEAAELLKNIHDLADLVTESIRQLNIRLNVMDERLESVAEERAAGLNKSICEIRSALKEQQRIIKETNDRLTAHAAGQQTDKGTAQLLIDLEKHASFLDSHMERNTAELRHKLEEHRDGLWAQFNSKVIASEKESRDYLNRSLFSLGILVVIVAFIAGVLTVNTMDRACNYLTQSVETLRAHLDQVSGQRQSGTEH